MVQGEGGFNAVPKAYLEQLRVFCDEHGIILIFDEIQSGFGRTGKWAAALATIKLMKEFYLNDRAIEIGEIIKNRFEKLYKYPEVGDIRGIGAMQAIEFVYNGDARKPNHKLCENVVKGCAQKGLILLSAGTFKNIVRILAPLVITNNELNKGLDIMENEMHTLLEKS